MNIIDHTNPASEDFITASYKLSPTEQQLILSVFSKYENVENIPQICEITVQEFQNYYPDNHDNTLKNLKKAVNNLYERDSYFYQSEDCGWRSRWVEFIRFNGEEQKIVLAFSQTLRPFLEHLLNTFTTPTIVPMVPLKSINSIRLFEYIQSIYKEGEAQMSVAEIREILQLGNKYSMVSRLKERVLEPAGKELNAKLGLNIKMKQVKNGRAVTHFRMTWDILDDSTMGKTEL